MGVSREVEIACEIRGETALAYRVYDGKVTEWVPKSQITDYCEESNVITSVFIPEWLALEKGFL